MPVRSIQADDEQEWLRMRRTLWPECSDEMHQLEMKEQTEEGLAVFVFERDGKGLGGFIEVSIRSRVDGSMSERTGYVEGWYVDPDLRSKGIGKQLMSSAEEWTRSQGLTEIGSDAELENVQSIAAHKALGFKETFRLVHFLKKV